MKKRLNIFASLLFTASVLAGCSLAKEDLQDAADALDSELSSALSDSASEEFSSEIIILKDLIEPLFEESSAAASTSSVEKEPEEKKEEEEPVDKLNIVFFGDSQIANGRSDGSDIATMLTTRVPNTVTYNLGIGGTAAALEQTTSDYQDYENWSSTCFVGMVYALEGKVSRDRVLENYPNVLENMNKIKPEEVDYYIIEYGANDFFNQTPLDHTKTDKNAVYSFYGALCKGIDELRTISPNAKFIVMSPFYGVYKDADGNIIGDSYIVSNGQGTLADYAKKSFNVCEDNEAIDFDGMFMSHADLYMDHIEEYTIDGIHLSLTGRQIFTRLLAHVVNWSEGYEPYAYLENDIIHIETFDPNEDYRYRDDMLKEFYPEYYEKMMNGEYLLVQPMPESESDSDSEGSSEDNQDTSDQESSSDG